MSLIVLGHANGASAAPRKAGPPSLRAAAPRIHKVGLDVPSVRTADRAAALAALLQRLPGVRSAVVDADIRLGVVDFDAASTNLPAILAACRAAGFPAEEYRVEKRFPKPIRLKGG